MIVKKVLIGTFLFTLTFKAPKKWGPQIFLQALLLENLGKGTTSET